MQNTEERLENERNSLLLLLRVQEKLLVEQDIALRDISQQLETLRGRVVARAEDEVSEAADVL